MKAFWRKDSKKKEYRPVSIVASAWHSDEDDANNDVISLHEFETVQQPLLSPENGMFVIKGF